MSVDPFLPRRAGMGWEFTHDAGLRLEIENMSAGSGSLYAYTRLSWENGDGDLRVLSSGKRDLLGPRTVASILADIKSAGPKFYGWWKDDGSAWHQLITDALEHVRNQHFAGKDTVDLARVGGTSFSWIVRPVVESGGHTRLIAAGGAGKSFLVLAIALSVATKQASPFGTIPTVTGPVLYLDWETQDEGRTHGYRLAAVAAGMEVELEEGMVLHQQHDLPLAERADSVAKLADKADCPLVIVDSNTMARGSGGRAGFEAATTDLLQALRIIGRPALIIDHKSKQQIDKGTTGGYGSVHNENQVRLQWEYTRAHDHPDDRKLILLENTKQNNVRQQAPIGMAMNFHNDLDDPDRPRLEAVTFELISPNLVRGHHPGSTDELGSGAEAAIKWMFEHGPATINAVAEAVGVDRSSANRFLKSDGRFRKVGRDGRADVYGLTDDAPATLGLESAVSGEPLEAPW